MRDRLVKLSVVIVPAAAAAVALASCGGSAATATVPGAGQSGMSHDAPDMGAAVSDALAVLVDDGTITSAQKDVVVAAFGDGARPGGPGPQASPPPPGQEPATKAQAPGGDDMVASVLAPLVDDGTLTEAQSDAIAHALADALPDVPRARSPPSDASQT